MRLKGPCSVVALCLLASIRAAAQTTAHAVSRKPCSAEVADKLSGCEDCYSEGPRRDDKTLFQKDHGNDCPGLVNLNFLRRRKPRSVVLM